MTDITDTSGTVVHSVAGDLLAALADAQRRIAELEQQLASAQAEVRGLVRDRDTAEYEARALRETMTALQAEARELRERSAHVDRGATRLAVEKDTLAQELARVLEDRNRYLHAARCAYGLLLQELADTERVREARRLLLEALPDEERKRGIHYAMQRAGLTEAEIVAALSRAAEQHDPLAVSDHCGECGEPEPECVCGEQPAERESLPLMARDTCTNCGGTGVGGYHVHAPQEDAVEALRCEACDGFGYISAAQESGDAD